MKNEFNPPVLSGQRRILTWLHQHWQRFATFMVMADASDQKANEIMPYQAKARYYPYLSAHEEQRDWLNKIYRQS